MERFLILSFFYRPGVPLEHKSCTTDRTMNEMRRNGSLIEIQLLGTKYVFFSTTGVGCSAKRQTHVKNPPENSGGTVCFGFNQEF